MLQLLHMKQSKIIIILGIWFVLVPIMGIPLSIKKFLIIVPGLFVIAMGITMMRSDRLRKSLLHKKDKEIIHNIAEDVVEEVNEITEQEMKNLRDVL